MTTAREATMTTTTTTRPGVCADCGEPTVDRCPECGCGVECGPCRCDRPGRERLISSAESIITAEGAASWVGLRDPERLGCSVAEHEEWLATASPDEIRAWARSVVPEEV